MGAKSLLQEYYWWNFLSCSCEASSVWLILSHASQHCGESHRVIYTKCRECSKPSPLFKNSARLCAHRWFRTNKRIHLLSQIPVTASRDFKTTSKCSSTIRDTSIRITGAFGEHPHTNNHYQGIYVNKWNQQFSKIISAFHSHNATSMNAMQNFIW